MVSYITTYETPVGTRLQIYKYADTAYDLPILGNQRRGRVHMDDFELTQPTPDEIRALVQASGLSRSTAAELVHASRRPWDKCTTRADSSDNRPMPIADW